VSRGLVKGLWFPVGGERMDAGFAELQADDGDGF
jgi:hypothetical protein